MLKGAERGGGGAGVDDQCNAAEAAHLSTMTGSCGAPRSDGADCCNQHGTGRNGGVDG